MEHISSGTLEQKALLGRFVSACQADERVLAAFLGGSFASGKADQFSDLDIYIITKDEAYDAFFADRQTFMRKLGEPVFLEDFNQFGFDMILFTYADGVEGELALGRETNFLHIHGGPYEVLLDKKGILEGVSFPMFVPEFEPLPVLDHTLKWFWEDLSRFITAMQRGRIWSAYGYLEQMRVKCLDLLRLKHDFTVQPEGYFGAQRVVPDAELTSLKATFSVPEPEPLVTAALNLLQVYRQVARPLAAQHQLVYPDGLDRVLSARLDKLRDTLQAAPPHSSAS
jgi:predicted nucleotidyltransferase